MKELQLIYPDWPAHGSVCAVATTRQGGCSADAYASLNLGEHVGDNPRMVMRNREILQSSIQLPAAPCWLTQVHGSNVVRADDGAGSVDADAAWTDTPGVVCAVLTADCLPVLFCARDGARVAALHAGWRGLCAGVLEQMAGNFLLADIPPDDILVWLGPAISPDAYEVDATVRDVFLRREPVCESSFTPTRRGHWNLNLYAAARAVLAAQGVMHVSGGDLCTYHDQRFYSHRRDFRCGRQATLIWLSS